MMAFGGLRRHGRSGSSRGPAHGSGAGGGHGHAHGVARAHGRAPATAQPRGPVHHAGGLATRAFFLLTSPRLLFSVMIGFGATGQLFKGSLGGPVLPLVALAGGILFERLIITPIWNLTLRFASRPAVTLESAMTDEATAVTSFDANGEGIISVELDGQIVQLLARLQPADRIPGMKVRAGQRLRIEEVNAATRGAAEKRGALFRELRRAFGAEAGPGATRSMA